MLILMPLREKRVLLVVVAVAADPKLLARLPTLLKVKKKPKERAATTNAVVEARAVVLEARVVVVVAVQTSNRPIALRTRTAGSTNIIIWTVLNTPR